MVILALDTTTRAGSVALMSDGRLQGSSSGDENRTHGERLPGDLLALLAGHGRTLSDVDLFAVSAGPGSFTGLRVGLATIQGLALAHHRQVVGVPTLEALAYAGLWDRSMTPRPSLIVPWMDAQRGEVFGAIYSRSSDDLLEVRHPGSVGNAETLLETFAPKLQESPVLFVGNAVEASGAAFGGVVRDQSFSTQPMPALASVVARLAHMRGPESATAPHAIRPVYVRRPDAELARERRR